MSYDEIMKNITHGLSGNYETDREYLQEQMEKYKDHELGKEIIRACGRILYEILPEDKKEELAKVMRKEDLGVEATLDEVRFNIYKKDYKKADMLMKALVNKAEELEESGLFQDDSVSMYFTFNNLFEELLYMIRNKPKKDVRRSDIPFAEIYLQYGSLLFELKRYEEAREMLKKAVRWNPCNAQIAFEYAETFKIVGDLESFFKVSVDTFNIAYTPNDIARCYRNLAFYFVEKELWSEALACNLMSLQYNHKSTNAMSEMYYIQQKTNGSVPEPGVEELKSYSQKYGFPLGADDDVLGIAYAYGKHSLEEEQYEVARFFFTILYELTDDEEIKSIIDQLPEEE